MNERVGVVFIWKGGVVVEDAVEDAISYEIGFCHLFSGLKVDVNLVDVKVNLLGKLPPLT